MSRPYRADVDTSIHLRERTKVRARAHASSVIYPLSLEVITKSTISAYLEEA